MYDAAPRPRRVWPGLVVIAVVTAVAALIAYVILSEPSQSGTMGSVGTRITGIPSPSPSATAPPTTTSSVAPEPPPSSHDYVAQGMPESFAIVCDGEPLVATQNLTTTFRQLRYADYETMTKHYDLAIEGDTIALVQDDQKPWAAKPGSDAGTVSIWGHASRSPRMAFNPIAEYRGDPTGCAATITVPGGILEYGYVQSHLVTPKSDQLNKSEELSTMPDKAGKLLVSTCSDADSEIIWEFTLVSSKAA